MKPLSLSDNDGADGAHVGLTLLFIIDPRDPRPTAELTLTDDDRDTLQQWTKSSQALTQRYR
ncbi:MAG: hypothetical protein ACRDTK_00235 [Mycobacterium sp.]